MGRGKPVGTGGGVSVVAARCVGWGAAVPWAPPQPTRTNAKTDTVVATIQRRPMVSSSFGRSELRYHTILPWRASWWSAAGLEESRAKAAALEFLAHCQTTEQAAKMAALNKWAHSECEG